MAATADPVLLRPLTAQERSLLDAVWDPIRTPIRQASSWPVWDYVSRTYYLSHPEGPPAETVLAGLPSSPAQGIYGAYGLCWVRDAVPPSGPNPDQQIGLTIAGLYALSEAKTPLRQVADELAGIVGSVARQTADLPVDPTKVVREYVPLAPLTESLARPSREKPTIVSAHVAAQVLQREFARVPLRSFGAEMEGNIDVELSGPWLRPFLGVETAEAYMRVAWPERGAVELPTTAPTPLTLVQTIDYFSFVLESTSVWRKHRRDRSHRLVRVRSLISATQLGLPATSGDEFNARVGAFWTIADHLDIPIVDANAYEQRYESKGTLNALQLLLEAAVRDDPGDRADLDRALKTIRDVRLLRNEADHNSSETRQAGIAARRRLGLPDVIWDWGSAWDATRAGLAQAFDALILSLQTAESD